MRSLFSYPVIQKQLSNISGSAYPNSIGSLMPFPLIAYAPENEDTQTGPLITWLTEVSTMLMQMHEQRAEQMMVNTDFYNGIQHLSNNYSGISAIDERGRYLSDSDLFVMNHARDFVNQKVASVTKYKGQVNVLPWNSTYSDRIGAKTSKRAIDTIFHYNDVDTLLRDYAMHAAICGEGYLKVEFDKSMGDLSKEEQAIGEIVNSGAQWANNDMTEWVRPDGTTIYIDKKLRIGDVKVSSLYPWLVLKEPAMSWRDLNYLFIINIRHRDELAAMYPDIDIEVSGIDMFGNFTQMNTFQDYVLEFEFYHKRHNLLDGGFYAKFVQGQLLESGKNPNTTGTLPIVRLTDYDDEMTPHGRSFLEDIRPPLILYNKILNIMYRNLAIAAHPKLMVPAGSVNVNSLGSGGPLIVEYNGDTKPELMTFTGTTGEMFRVSDKLMSDIQTVAGSSAFARGEVVANARAGSILNAYQEQQEQRNGMWTDKFVGGIEKLGNLVLDCASDNWKTDDGRMLKIFGKNNRYKVRDLLDVGSLKGPYDVKIQRTTALADTKQGRIDQIVQLSTIQANMGAGSPPIFTPEQLTRLIDIGDVEAMYDITSEPVDAAASENEDMYEGLPVDAPQRFQYHIVHWLQHVQFMQSKEFADTASVPETIRQAFAEHVTVHEVLLYELAKQSFAACQEIAKLPYYPMFITIGPDSGLPMFQLTIAQLAMMHQIPPMPPMSPEQAAPPVEQPL